MERDAEVVTRLVLRGVDRAARACARGARWLTAVVLTAMVAGAFVTAVAIVRLGFSKLAAGDCDRRGRRGGPRLSRSIDRVQVGVAGRRRSPLGVVGKYRPLLGQGWAQRSKAERSEALGGRPALGWLG